MRGAALGEYHIRGPDIGLNILVGSMAGWSPRVYNWFFEVRPFSRCLGHDSSACGCALSMAHLAVFGIVDVPSSWQPPVMQVVLAPIVVLLTEIAVPMSDRVVRKHRRAASGGT